MIGSSLSWSLKLNAYLSIDAGVLVGFKSSKACRTDYALLVIMCLERPKRSLEQGFSLNGPCQRGGTQVADF